jgi:hypothetical protein
MSAELTGILGDLAKVSGLEFNVDTYISALSWTRAIQLTIKSSSDGIFGRSEDHLALDRGIIGGPIVLAHPLYPIASLDKMDSPHDKAELVPDTLTTW